MKRINWKSGKVRIRKLYPGGNSLMGVDDEGVVWRYAGDGRGWKQCNMTRIVPDVNRATEDEIAWKVWDGSEEPF